MKRQPMRVRLQGAERARVTGDGAKSDYNLSAWFFRGHAGRFGGYLHNNSVSALFRNARARQQPIVVTSGKKDKKFWRKVQRRIARWVP